ENDKDGVRGRCIAAHYSVMVRAVIGRLDNEHPARASGRTNHGQVCNRLLRHKSCKVLANKELSDFAFAVCLFFLEPAVIIRLYGYYLPTKREHKQDEQEPPKHGRKLHVWHLPRRIRP